MNEQKSLLTHLSEALDHYRAERRTVAAQQTPPEPRRRLRHLLPTPGNVIFTLVMIAALLWAQSAGAVPFRAESAASTGTIAYQGRLADSSGGSLNFAFASCPCKPPVIQSQRQVQTSLFPPQRSRGLPLFLLRRLCAPGDLFVLRPF